MISCMLSASLRLFGRCRSSDCGVGQWSYSISNGLVGADENSVLPSALTSFFREVYGLRYHEVVDSMSGAIGGADSIERALQFHHEVRVMHQFETHSRDEEFGHLPLGIRFSDLMGQDNEKLYHSFRQRSSRSYKRRRNKIRHLTENPILSRTKCQSCGSLGHGDWNVRKCPVLALRVGLGCEDPKLLETYPCLFCDHLGHTTRMCRVMHSLCRNCGHRGHVGN